MRKADRQKVFDKYGGKCAYCGCELLKGWHVDHFASVGRRMAWDKVNSKWVPDGMDRPENDNIENYMPSCASCNMMKHSGTLEDFRNTIAGFVNSLNMYHTQYKFAKRYGLITETGASVKFYFETIEETKAATA